MARFIKKYAESIIWSGALVLLFFMNPSENGTSLCILKNLGATWCPGCGLGHSMHYALHGHFAQSWEEHVLGIPAVLILVYQISKSIYLTNKKSNNGPTKNFNDVSGYGFRRTL